MLMVWLASIGVPPRSFRAAHTDDLSQLAMAQGFCANSGSSRQMQGLCTLLYRCLALKKIVPKRYERFMYNSSFCPVLFRPVTF